MTTKLGTWIAFREVQALLTKFILPLNSSGGGGGGEIHPAKVELTLTL